QLPLHRFAEQRVDTRGRDAADSRWSTRIEYQQRRGQRTLAARAGPDRGAVGVQLCKIRVALDQRAQYRDEEQRPSEDATDGEAQGITNQLVMVFVREHGVELGDRQRLERARRDVDLRPQVSGAESLRARARDHLYGRVAVDALDDVQPLEEAAVRGALA